MCGHPDVKNEAVPLPPTTKKHFSQSILDLPNHHFYKNSSVKYDAMQRSRARKHTLVLEKVSDFKAKFFSPKVGIIYTLSRTNGAKHMFQKGKGKFYLKQQWGIFLNANNTFILTAWCLPKKLSHV